MRPSTRVAIAAGSVEARPSAATAQRLPSAPSTGPEDELPATLTPSAGIAVILVQGRKPPEGGPAAGARSQRRTPSKCRAPAPPFRSAYSSAPATGSEDELPAALSQARPTEFGRRLRTAVVDPQSGSHPIGPYSGDPAHCADAAHADRALLIRVHRPHRERDSHRSGPKIIACGSIGAASRSGSRRASARSNRQSRRPPSRGYRRRCGRQARPAPAGAPR